MSLTVQIPVEYMVPDSSGNAYSTVVAGTNVRLLLPAFAHDVDAKWWGKVRIPKDYSSSPTLILRVGANSTAGQVTSFIVATIPRNTTAGWDASAPTAETVQDLTLPVTAYQPSDMVFTLSTVPSVGDDLVFYVQHNGTRVQDTLAVDSLLFATVFQYSTA